MDTVSDSSWPLRNKRNGCSRVRIHARIPDGRCPALLGVNADGVGRDHIFENRGHVPTRGALKDTEQKENKEKTGFRTL